MDYKEEIKETCRVLEEGGIIIYPTDTIWGIGCDATNPEAVRKVYELKKRTDSKALIILVDSSAKIDFYVDSPNNLAFDIIDTATKPLTIIYDHARNMAENLLAEDGSVGIRITEESFSKALCQRFRKAIVSTSANISGEPSPQCFSDINKELLEAVDYVVKFRQDEMTSTKPSSIIKLNRDGQVKIIRE